MHAVIETAPYLRAAEHAGLTEDERADIITLVAINPDLGDIIPGTGGCRKARIPGRGRGKSGGYRLITFYSGAGVPVFLLTVFGKGEKANLSGAEKNTLAKLTKMLVASLTEKIVPMRMRR